VRFATAEIVPGARRATASALFAAMIAVVLAAAVLPASATHEPLSDPNDTEGRFDVSLVEHRHKARPRVWLIAMGPKWTIRNSWDAGYAIVNLDTTGTPQQDYYALVRSNGKRLLAQVFRDRRRGRDRVIAKPRSWKDGRTIGLEVPWSKLNVGDARDSYRWSVQTLWIGGSCPRTCFDLAPNGGDWVEQLYEEPPEPPRDANDGGNGNLDPTPAEEPESPGPTGTPTPSPTDPTPTATDPPSATPTDPTPSGSTPPSSA
jgi:hypothetical protein